MYSPTRPHEYKDNGRKARERAIARCRAAIERLKVIDAAHAENSAMDVVELLQDLPGFYLFGIRETFKRVQGEIEELGFPKIAAMIAEQVEALSAMEATLRRAHDAAHNAYRERQVEIISASLSRKAREWLRDAPESNGSLDAKPLAAKVRDELEGHHLFHEANGTGWRSLAYLGRGVRARLRELANA